MNRRLSRIQVLNDTKLPGCCSHAIKLCLPEHLLRIIHSIFTDSCRLLVRDCWVASNILEIRMPFRLINLNTISAQCNFKRRSDLLYYAEQKSKLQKNCPKKRK